MSASDAQIEQYKAMHHIVGLWLHQDEERLDRIRRKIWFARMIGRRPRLSSDERMHIRAMSWRRRRPKYGIDFGPGIDTAGCM